MRRAVLLMLLLLLLLFLFLWCAGRRLSDEFLHFFPSLRHMIDYFRIYFAMWCRLRMLFLAFFLLNVHAVKSALLSLYLAFLCVSVKFQHVLWFACYFLSYYKLVYRVEDSGPSSSHTRELVPRHVSVFFSLNYWGWGSALVKDVAHKS